MHFFSKLNEGLPDFFPTEISFVGRVSSTCISLPGTWYRNYPRGIANVLTHSKQQHKI